ncbi:MAG TPA: hypothetical protein VK338_05625, partial [Candidatus Nitrosocosmicus sp.]|nr:hypothetical protein [Candidatus Nitrosocosmicus sp.]
YTLYSIVPQIVKLNDKSTSVPLVSITIKQNHQMNYLDRLSFKRNNLVYGLLKLLSVICYLLSVNIYQWL